jgi:two-component system cell cycle response regulator
MSGNSTEKQRLLIVDDSKVIRVTARKILRDHFETIEAVDGENAWEILTAEAPVSLVVSDLTMPKLDGFGLLKRIRSSHLPHLRELPVIIITGSNDTESTMESARQCGATDFIGKPFDAVHLLARTQAHANSHAVTNVLKEANAALEELTTLDPVTGLANEAAFMERGYQQLSYAIRHGSTLTLLRMEIDGYGTLYRKYGASFSETILQTVAKILLDAIRQEDTAARTGTARFALLLPGMNKAGVRGLAERINSSIATRVFKSGNDKATITVSLGVASPGIRRDMQLSELITTADECLSRAIAGGGNQAVFDDDPVRTPLPAKSVQTRRPAAGTNVGKSVAKPAAAPGAGKLHPFHGEGLEIEEIEITNAEFSFATFSTASRETTEIRNRASTMAGRESNNPAQPVSGKAVFTVATAAPNAKAALPVQPRPAPPAERASGPLTTPAKGAQNAEPAPGDAAKARALKTSPVPASTKDRPSAAAAISVGPEPLPPDGTQRATRPARRVKRQGLLKRMLTWLGLARLH